MPGPYTVPGPGISFFVLDRAYGLGGVVGVVGIK